MSSPDNPYSAPAKYRSETQGVDSPQPDGGTPPLVRGLGLWQATSLNVANMVGIGPFITIPLFISTMNGPHALIGWVAGAALVLCDGLVWSELGAALPGSGGTYHFLRETFGRYRWGRLLPFLFIWQFLVSGALEMASGCIGAVNYLAYVFPSLALAGKGITTEARWIAAGCAVAVMLLLCQHIRHLGKLSIVLCAGTLVTVLTVIVVGLANFDASLLRIDPAKLRLDRHFATGLGAAMIIAVYDYLGYYNVCHLGDEVREPGKTIPRAVMLSVAVIAVVYLTMNVCIIAVVPWQEAKDSQYIAATFMEHVFRKDVAVAFTWLILWTALASVFALMLGYSRIPYAAARQGDFFRVFGYVHPTRRFPAVSLFTLGALTAGCCFLDLGDLIDAAVCTRIGVQFIGQIAALHLLRRTRPDVKLPFRMWLYPLPSLVALGGWVFVLASTKEHVLWWSLVVLDLGCIAFLLRWLATRGRDRAMGR